MLKIKQKFQKYHKKLIKKHQSKYISNSRAKYLATIITIGIQCMI